MDRGNGNGVDYEAYGYDSQYYQSVPQTYYQQPYMYSGNQYTGQQFLSWNQGTAPQFNYPPPSFQQPFYSGADVNYGYYNMNGYDENQAQAGNSGTGQVRKYSYSQNRSRYRQRPDTRSKQSGNNDIDHGFGLPDENENNEETKNKLENENLNLTSGQSEARINHNRDTQKEFNQSRHFDKNTNSQQTDRKFSNKYANQLNGSSGNDEKKENSRKAADIDTEKDGARNTASSGFTDTKANFRAKSYSNQRYKDDSSKSRKHFSKSLQNADRPALASTDNISKSYENDSDNRNKPKKYEKYSKELVKESVDVPQPDGASNVSDPFYGARKKKKETFIFSSSGHRDIRNNQDLSRQQNFHNRFNYRGMDYNKRHKEEPRLERGSERTKLSGNVKKEKDGEDYENEGKNDENLQSKNQNSDRKNKGTRIQRQMTVDESQRGNSF